MPSARSKPLVIAAAARLRRASVVAAVLTTTSLAVAPATADSLRLSADDPRWRDECGSCHLPFPPQLMSAAGWRQVMAALDRHYGTDATLDAPTAVAIGAFLDRHAGTGKRAALPAVTKAGVAGPTLPRITTSPWFVREHREVPASTVARSDVGGLANCAACHVRAEQGDYSERNLRVPR